MYSELIYTRCGEGIDILRGRNPIKNSGFKVFSCSENVTEAGFTDLPFLYATAQSKEPYADPSFMDDAYLFVVPDLGGKYLLNFHPIPFNRTVTGDYSHRPGNFIKCLLRYSILQNHEEEPVSGQQGSLYLLQQPLWL